MTTKLITPPPLLDSVESAWDSVNTVINNLIDPQQWFDLRGKSTLHMFYYANGSDTVTQSVINVSFTNEPATSTTFFGSEKLTPTSITTITGATATFTTGSIVIPADPGGGAATVRVAWEGLPYRYVAVDLVGVGGSTGISGVHIYAHLYTR